MSLKAQAVTWWKSREEREQKLLIVLSIIFVLFILIKVVWLGLNQQQETEQRNVDDKKQLLALMTANQAKLKALRMGGKRVYSNRQSLLSIADLSANRVRIPSASKKRMKPLGSGGKKLSVEFEAIKFDQALGWLELLSKDPSLRLENLLLKRRKETGMTDLKVIVQRAAK